MVVREIFLLELNGPDVTPRSGGKGNLLQRAALVSLLGPQKFVDKLIVLAAPRALRSPAAGSVNHEGILARPRALQRGAIG